MLVVGASHLPWCTENSFRSDSCAFKHMWFDDIPLCMPVNGSESGLTVTIRSCSKMAQFLMNVQRNLLDHILAKIQFTLIVNLQHLNLDLCRVFLRNRAHRLRLFPSTAERCGLIVEKPSPPALSNLPVELRLQIYNYVMQDTTVSAVGYRNEKQDAFYFKQRGHCHLLMTCKQFYYEGMGLYFENLTVSIKAACPSEFTGDMSNFGSLRFKNSLKRVRIADEDEPRRKRIESAFKHAQIEHSSKSVRSSRKSAYYFG